MNTKKVCRLYREEHLLVRTKRRRTPAARLRVALPSSVRVNERWGMDFLLDQLSNEQRFRIPTVVDLFSRECLCRYASRSSPVQEDTSRHFDAWAHGRGVRLDFITPGRPVENGYIETFNGILRDECLSLHGFAARAEAQKTLNYRRRHYHKTRPHSSLGNLDQLINPRAFRIKGLGLESDGMEFEGQDLTPAWPQLTKAILATTFGLLLATTLSIALPLGYEPTSP